MLLYPGAVLSATRATAARYESQYLILPYILYGRVGVKVWGYLPAAIRGASNTSELSSTTSTANPSLPVTELRRV